jgi:hypothetical protein
MESPIMAEVTCSMLVAGENGPDNFSLYGDMVSMATKPMVEGGNLFCVYGRGRFRTWPAYVLAIGKEREREQQLLCSEQVLFVVLSNTHGILLSPTFQT